jgi:hypothetical protein
MNWDENGERRQFMVQHRSQGYALYVKTKDDIEIVEPKAHGLGYFYPPKDLRGWEDETPEWILRMGWIVRGVLGLKRESLWPVFR